MAHQQPRNRVVSTVLIGGLFLAATAVPGCSSSAPSAVSTPTTATTTTPTPAKSAAPAAPDYSDATNWLAKPTTAAHGIDVFYLYPTVWTRPNAAGPMTAAIGDPNMRKGAKMALNGQASVFGPIGNIYAPYYRQASAEVLAMSVADRDTIINDIPTADALAGFDYYITHLNQGRPYVLAGHSQGSNLLVNLLASYMKAHPDRYARMVAAYVIGYSITTSYLARNPHLKFASGADDTGVIISYNTQSPNVTGTNPVLLPGALAINPISWTRTQTTAPASDNLGSLVPNADRTGSTFVDNLADARVDSGKGIVVCSTCDVATYSSTNPAFPRGVFHSDDYPFYYFNLRANAATRVAAWAKHPASR